MRKDQVIQTLRAAFLDWFRDNKRAIFYFIFYSAFGILFAVPFVAILFVILCTHIFPLTLMICLNIIGHSAYILSLFYEDRDSNDTLDHEIKINKDFFQKLEKMEQISSNHNILQLVQFTIICFIVVHTAFIVQDIIKKVDFCIEKIKENDNQKENKKGD